MNQGGPHRSFEPKQDFKPYEKRDVQVYHKNDLSDKSSDWVSYKRPIEKPIEVKVEESSLLSSPLPKVTDESVAEVDICEQTDSTQKVLDKSRPPQADTDFSSEKITSPKSLDKKESIGTGLSYKRKQGEKKFSGRCRLFVANLNNNTSEKDLRDLFAPFGESGEVYVNNQKGFGFIRLDYRHNAEVAKSSLDKVLFKGRILQVRFATHASAIELHGLDQFASNEYIEQAMSQFGNVERAVVVCDDRGHSKGRAIVEFEWKKSAQKVLDRFKEEMFVLGRLPKPVLAKPLIQQDDEEGVHEAEVQKFQGYSNEREFSPRFISPSSFEFTWAKKWRDLFIEEEDKKARLEQEIQDARFNLENEMEAAIRQQEAVRIREDLLRRQEELRQIEEDLQKRSAVINLRNENRILENDRKREYDSSRNVPLPPRDFHQQRQIVFNDDIARQNEFILRQQAELEMRRGELLRGVAMPTNMITIRPEMMRPANIPLGNLQMPPRTVIHGLPHGFMPAPRMQLASTMQRQMRPPMMQGGPQHGINLAPPPRGAERFDHKRLRRN